MKLNETMRKEFDRAVRARYMELISERIEAAAQALVDEAANGGERRPHTKASHKVAYPPSTILRRGSRDGVLVFRPSTPSGQMALAAWEALARDGHFASKATRADMTAYLMKTFEGVNSSQVAATLSLAIKRGALTAEAPRQAV